MRTYKERIDLIATCLSRLNIPFEMRPIWEGWQILCPWADNADVAAPRKGDKYDRKTGIAVAFAKTRDAEIPKYI